MISESDKTLTVSRAVVLLPVAFLLYLAEEWFGGLSEWTLLALGNEITPDRFLLINSIVFAIFVAGTLAVFYYPRMIWLSILFVALLGLNE